MIRLCGSLRVQNVWPARLLVYMYVYRFSRGLWDEHVYVCRAPSAITRTTKCEWSFYLHSSPYDPLINLSSSPRSPPSFASFAFCTLQATNSWAGPVNKDYYTIACCKQACLGEMARKTIREDYHWRERAARGNQIMCVCGGVPRECYSTIIYQRAQGHFQARSHPNLTSPSCLGRPTSSQP